MIYSLLSMSDNSRIVKTKYKNISISGLPGAGSTTLGKHLAQHLSFKYYSGGDFMRQYAIEKGYINPKKLLHHSATVYPDDFDRQVDYGVRGRMTTDMGCVYESWLSGFLAQQVEGVFKILVYCSDDGVRVDRIANRDDITIHEAKEHIFAREDKNLAKWVAMYKTEWKEWVVKPGTLSAKEPIYFWRPELYDLVVDTFRLGKEETLELVIKAIAKNWP